MRFGYKVQGTSADQTHWSAAGVIDAHGIVAAYVESVRQARAGLSKPVSVNRIEIWRINEHEQDQD
jgi:hypothetical protein